MKLDPAQSIPPPPPFYNFIKRAERGEVRALGEMVRERVRLATTEDESGSAAPMFINRVFI